MEYTANPPRAGNPMVCKQPASSYTDTDLMKPFSGGVSSDSLIPEASTGRVSISALQAHVSALTAAGVIKARPSQTVGPDKETDMAKLVADDADLYNRLQQEYCYYEQRYKYAFQNFLRLATSRDAADNRAAEAMLRNSKLLNLRLNGVLEIMNYLAASRVDVVNSNKEDINKRNAEINTKLSTLRKGYELLSKDNAVILTQREMVRYTEEKNNYTKNQIGLWAAANVVALGVIFYVYRAV
jgi:hypothetical protein